MALFDRPLNLFDPKGINRANRDYVAQQQQKRAAGELGLSEGQKEAMVSRGQEQVGAATQAALSQMPTSGVDAATQQRMFQGATGGMQQALAQNKAGADLASEERAANAAAELNALEQGVFKRRQDNRDYFTGLAGKGIQIAGEIASKAPLACWVAVALWGEDSPRTFEARLYALVVDNWWTRLYRERGVGWARVVSGSKVARALALPLWHFMAWRGRCVMKTLSAHDIAKGFGSSPLGVE